MANVFLTFGTLVLLGLQWSELTRSDRANEAVQRAFVYMQPSGFDKKRNVDGSVDWIGRTSLQNAGATPVTKMSYYLGCSDKRSDIEKNYQNVVLVYDLGPHQTDRDLKGCVVKDADIKRLVKSGGSLFLYGKVSYHDDLGKKCAPDRKTEFCVEMKHIVKQLGTLNSDASHCTPNGGFTGGNCVDDNCPVSTR